MVVGLAAEGLLEHSMQLTEQDPQAAIASLAVAVSMAAVAMGITGAEFTSLMNHNYRISAQSIQEAALDAIDTEPSEPN